VIYDSLDPFEAGDSQIIAEMDRMSAKRINPDNIPRDVGPLEHIVASSGNTPLLNAGQPPYKLLNRGSGWAGTYDNPKPRRSIRRGLFKYGLILTAAAVIAGAAAFAYGSLTGRINDPNGVNPPPITQTYTPPTTSSPPITTEPIQTTEPTSSVTPGPTNSYDFAKSLGLEADYLRELNFDDNAKEFINYLSSLPEQMRTIAADSGLTEKLITDKQITDDEAGYFKKLIGSYQKEIETMQPWLNQLSEQEATDALALNLSNFREVSKDEMFYTLDGDKLPSLLPQALFVADGVIRKYAAEIANPDKWREEITDKLVYALAMVENIENFNDIHSKAWEVANSPDAKYGGQPIEEILHQGYFEGEAVGSTDKGQNAYEDMKLLLESGSPAAKAALRIYARNMTREGRQGSAEQVRCELTAIDAWSIGIPSYTVVLAGHDVPTIPLTLDDIALLKGRSSDPLFVLEIDGSYHIPLQWTRTSIVKKEWQDFYLINGIKATELKVSDLKPY
jgi:hypothetical protein